MKALVFDGQLRFDARRPEPPAAMGDALLRTRQAGVCSTDVEITRGYMGFAGVLGHEFVADVVDAPERKLVGKRVVGEINCVCGRCDMCRGGLANHCRDRTVLGIQNHDGCFAELFRLPAANLHVLPDDIDDDAAVFVEPLAAACQVLKQVRIEPRTWVTVLGDGRLGLLVAQVLRNAGAPVRLVGKHPAKLALCERWQIRSRRVQDVTGQHDQDVVVDCTGSADGFETALAMLRPRGTLVLKSTVAGGKPMNLAPAVVNEISIVGSRCGPFREAIRLLSQKQVDVVSLISRRMRLEQGPDAIDLAKRGALKVLLTIDR